MTHAALWLSQAQFFMSLSFTLLFLLLEIGLAWALAVFRLRALAGQGYWLDAYRFWVRIFALAFILAFASAVPVMVQFGSLWPDLMDRIGNVASPLLAVSVLSIFVFKSCLVGAMLFGQRRMSERLHVTLVVLVAVGVTIAAIWPVMLFSWLRTPDGAVYSGGQYLVTSWFQVFFNPSFPWYAALFLAVAFSTSSLFMLGVSALQSLRRPLLEPDKAVFRGAVVASMLSLLFLGMLGMGAGTALAPLEPARAAAALGYWKSGTTPSLAIAAVPDIAAGDRWAWRWHDAGGAFLARDERGAYRGLDQFSGMAPPPGLTFWTLRIAVLAAALMLLASTYSWIRLRKTAYEPSTLPVWLRRSLVAMIPLGGLLVVSGFAHLVVGAHPYAVAGTVTLSEVLVGVPLSQLVLGGIALLAVYAFCMLGFFQLLWHGIHYGVVPVTRYRGRA